MGSIGDSPNMERQEPELRLQIEMQQLGAEEDVVEVEKTTSKWWQFTKEERNRITVLFITSLFLIPFVTTGELYRSSLNFFTKERVDRMVLGWEISDAWFQPFSTMLVIVMGPLLAWSWNFLSEKGKEPPATVKMGLASLALGTGFLFLTVAGFVSDSTISSSEGSEPAKVSPLWLLGSIILVTFGELLFYPTGLSLVTKLAPERIASFCLGIWFAIPFFGVLASGFLAGLINMMGKGFFFLIFVISSYVAGILLLLSTPFLKKWMHSRA